MNILKASYNTFKKLDMWIFIPFLILSIIGIIMVYSASSDIAMQSGGSSLGYLIKQTFYLIVGLVVIVFIFHAKFLRNSHFLMASALIILIMLIYLKGFGKSINGASGWISFFGLFNIQPSEITKFYFIIFIANHVDHYQNQLVHHWLKNMTNVIVYSFITLSLILVQPDLGGAAINLGIIIVMCLASGIRYQKAIMIFCAGFFLALIIFKFTLIPASMHSSNYQLQRIVAFSNPFAYAHGIGQQLVNSYYALSNGGVFGTGLGNSIQKNGYLPEPNTDFIMAIIAEELGLVIVIIIMVLLGIIVCRTVLIGIRSNNTYAALVCYGTGAYLTIQTLFNVGGVTGMLPITGVAFPFISYGGSSMFTLSCCLGLVFRIYYHEKLRRKRLTIN